MEGAIPDENPSKETLNPEAPTVEERDKFQDGQADTVNHQELGNIKQDHPMIDNPHPSENERAWGNASASFSDEEEKRVLFGAIDSFRYASYICINIYRICFSNIGPLFCCA